MTHDRTAWSPTPVADATRRRRLLPRLTTDEADEAEALLDVGKTYGDIAAAQGHPIEHVAVAVALRRNPNPESGRAVLNVKPEQRDQLRVLAFPGEPVHQTVGRVLDLVASLERIGVRVPGATDPLPIKGPPC